MNFLHLETKLVYYIKNENFHRKKFRQKNFGRKSFRQIFQFQRKKFRTVFFK